jgi:hypothetical protein
MPPTSPDDDHPQPAEEREPHPPTDSGEDERSAAEREASEFGGE